ncbi:MAG: molecular chaperone DnaK [bacterium]
MAKIIGIDLGTTNSAVAVMEAGAPKILENAEGSRTTPSIVAISKTNERLVGLLAKRQAVTNPKNTVYGIKRFIGHSFDEAGVQADLKTVAYDLSKAANGGVNIKMADKDYSAEEVSAMILSKIKADVEAKLGEKITQAVITVPAYFNDSQRQATKDAGKIAGLEVMRIINEPTAAALAYGFNKKKDEKLAVFDFGGGTFDISILEVGDEVVEVKATDGDHRLGGRDIDYKLLNYIADEFKKENGIDLRKDPLAMQRLDESAEKAKIELSTATETEINIPFIANDDSGPRHLVLKITRAKLEEIADEFIERAMQITKRAIEASPFKVADINEIILVGGQTRMPKLRETVKAFFGKEPNLTINPDEVVALGAAIQGGVLGGDVTGILLLDVIPLSLGIETMGNVTTKLIERNTTIPTSRSQVFSTAADNQTSVEIHIVQGERALAQDNKSLGRFILDGVPPAPRGMPQVEVTFDVDANGILSVKAKEKATNKEQSIRIEASSSLSKEDIEKMKQDAELHAADDVKKKEEIEMRNTADNMIYTAEKAIRENKEKIPAEVITGVEEKVTALRAIKDTGEIEAVKKASEELSTEISKIGEALSKAAPAPEAGATPGAESATEPATGPETGSTEKTPEGDNVRDAETK